MPTAMRCGGAFSCCNELHRRKTDTGTGHLFQFAVSRSLLLLDTKEMQDVETHAARA